jgi:magnesium chelatase subunit D
LQADRILARNLLVPQLDAALDDGPGFATPLAHGLDLALHTLLHALQHGRGSIDRARLVVLTDGRGNVPLDASRRNQVSNPVGREGIEDGLAAAGRLARLDRIDSFFLDPEPREYPRLPEELATALGATRSIIPHRGEDQ